jgi:hypothetical protein
VIVIAIALHPGLLIERASKKWRDPGVVRRWTQQAEPDDQEFVPATIRRRSPALLIPGASVILPGPPAALSSKSPARLHPA